MRLHPFNLIAGRFKVFRKRGQRNVGKLAVQFVQPPVELQRIAFGRLFILVGEIADVVRVNERGPHQKRLIPTLLPKGVGGFFRQLSALISRDRFEPEGRLSLFGIPLVAFDMELAAIECLIPGFFENRSECRRIDIIRDDRLRPAASFFAVGFEIIEHMRHIAGQHAVARRHTDRVRTVGVFKANSARGQRIKVGRVHILIPRTAHQPRMLLVGGNQKNIRALPFAGRIPKRHSGNRKRGRCRNRGSNKFTTVHGLFTHQIALQQQ